MKKFYFLTLAAAVAFTATATDFSKEAPRALADKPMKKTAVANNLPSMASPMAMKNNTARFTKARKADGSESILGTWTFQLGDYYFDNESLGSIEYNMVAAMDDKNQYVVFSDPKDLIDPFYGTYDEATATLTFKQYYLGYIDNYYIFQKPYVYNYNTKDLEFQPIEAYHYANLGLLVFEPDNGLAFEAFYDAKATSSAGFNNIFDLEGADQPKDYGTWTNIGNATYVDGWVLPCIGGDQNNKANWYEVPLEQNDQNKNLYRVVDPYHVGPMAKYNSSTRKGYVMFDVTDPDHVLFLVSVSGFANPELGISRFYCNNQLGHYYAQNDEESTIEELVEDYGSDIPFTTFKDGVVELTFKDFGGDDILYDANFGTQTDPIWAYYWQYEDYSIADMTAAIVFPGAEYNAVEAITTDANAPVEYFNLQGMRVINPQAGQIVIKKQGSVTSKTIVR